jgi:hypothetical protein
MKKPPANGNTPSPAWRLDSLLHPAYDFSRKKIAGFSSVTSFPFVLLHNRCGKANQIS